MKTDQQRFEGFTTELAALSRKYGIVLQSTGGVSFLEPEAPELQNLTYSNDASSGDLEPRFPAA